ncbi:MAG: hypothetical protein EZS28_034938 [Streblomastix strix]|uniref:Transcriptional coactivator p15 (PC4) C-terminal domain-containing protein n=1 Tax=Streblomastix strix TaxID=222440 RepID=A0A5J4UFJ0_9EUKA|nr:MAG: hypothetical protein EZS28_034938 [Streblomastix strix]
MSEENFDDEEPPSKKQIPTKRTPAKADSSTTKAKRAKTDEDDGEQSWDLGNERKVEVKLFKGKAYVDIREYYRDKDGELKPGKKGIFLKPTEWDLILSYADQITEQLKKMQ